MYVLKAYIQTKEFKKSLGILLDFDISQSTVATKEFKVVAQG